MGSEGWALRGLSVLGLPKNGPWGMITGPLPGEASPSPLDGAFGDFLDIALILFSHLISGRSLLYISCPKV